MKFLTNFFVTLSSRHIGTDQYGNRYYEGRPRLPHGNPRRFVVYQGNAEASKVPPAWHGWLHHTENEVPSESLQRRYPWQKGHLPNLTGTVYAYRPKGADGNARSKGTGDYEAWKPE